MFVNSPASAEGSIPMPTQANSTEKYSHHDANSARFPDKPGVQGPQEIHLVLGKITKYGEISTNYK